MTIEKIKLPERHKMVLYNQGYIGLVDQMGNEATVVNAARTSFGKEIDEMGEKDVKLLKYLIRNGHNTPLEMVQFQFVVKLPIFIARQWMRHRTGSFSEVSRRYTSEDIDFYLPPEFRKQSDDNKQASTDETFDPVMLRAYDSASQGVQWVVEEAIDVYEAFIKAGICREQARMILPQNLMTTMRWRVDLHNLLHFLELRDHPHSQWEMRQYAKAIKELIMSDFPTISEIKEWDK